MTFWTVARRLYLVLFFPLMYVGVFVYQSQVASSPAGVSTLTQAVMALASSVGFAAWIVLSVHVVHRFDAWLAARRS